MPSMWKKSSEKASRHVDPDEAIARYLDKLHRADVAGTSPPASALNGLGDAYLDKGDVVSAVDHYRQAAEAYAREGMHTNAIACLKKVRRHAVDEGDVGLLLARYYAAKKLIPDALSELEEFAGRQQRIGHRKRAIEAVREIVRLAPGDGERRERLGDLFRQDGQEEAAVAAYREAARAFEEAGRPDAAARQREKIRALGHDLAAAQPEEPAPRPERTAAREATQVEKPEAEAPVGAPPGEERPVREAPPPAEAGEDHDDASLDLQIERTSYREQEEERFRRAREEAQEKLTVAQQTSGTDESVDPAEIQRTVVEEDAADTGLAENERDPGDLDGSPSLADAAAELERAAWDMEQPPEGGSVGPEPRSHAEMLAIAEQHVRAGETDHAAKYLLIAAEGLREESAWPEAAHAYRRLAEIGEAKGEDFEDWTECARQAGRASEVLEALSTAARWHLEMRDIPAARRSAEEMLLVDPNNRTALDILERIGASSSR